MRSRSKLLQPSVSLELPALSPAAAAPRMHAWQTACGIAGVTGAATHTGSDPDGLRFSQGPIETDALPIPMDERFDGSAAGLTAFPSDPRTAWARDASWDMIGAASYLLSLTEERRSGAPQHMRSLHINDCAHPEVYRFPWVDGLARWIIDRIDDAARAAGRLDLRVRPWPEAEAAVVPTFDTDEVRWSWRRRALMTATRPWTLLQDNAYWNVPRIQESLEARGYKGTFFFGFRGTGHAAHDIQYDAEHIAHEVRALVARGHEVGLHGSAESFADADRFGAETRRLAAILGVPATSTRQHFLNFDPDKTWRLHEANGFALDTTLQVRGMTGFEAGTSHPFAPADHTIVTLPLVAMDSYLFADPARSVDDALEELLSAWQLVHRHEGAMTLDWHNEWFHPRWYPRHASVLTRFLDRVEESPGVFKATCSDVVAAHRARHAVRWVRTGADAWTLDIKGGGTVDALDLEVLGTHDPVRAKSTGMDACTPVMSEAGRPILILRGIRDGATITLR